MTDKNKKSWNPPTFSKQEQSYRRGYCHGFLAAKRNPELTEDEVYAWRHGHEETAPPGSCMAGTKLDGLRKGETHKFILNLFDKEHDSE